MKNKTQIIYLGGGEAKENYSSYENYLQNYTFDPYKEKGIKWKRTLAEDLGEDYDVIQIPFPLKDFADYSQWKIMFEKVFSYLTDDYMFVAHSLGATFLIKYLNEENYKLYPTKILLLAPAYEDSEEEVLGTFSFSKNLEKFDTYYGSITTILHSSDDFIVPYSDFKHFQKLLKKPKFISFTDKNHFIIAEFPELLDLIKNK